MTHTVLSEEMKLADVVLEHYRLLDVLPCFDIDLGFGDATIAQICAQRAVSTQFFLLVCHVYIMDDYYPDTITLAKIPLSDLVNYLKRAHRDYLQYRIPTIVAQLTHLTAEEDGGHGRTIKSFCEKYQTELITHLDYEEQVVFPYIESMIAGNKSPHYHIEEYKGNHSDVHSALSDLKRLLIQYLPADFSIERSREALVQLFLFESDLAKHTLLEEQILISLVEQMEERM